MLEINEQWWLKDVHQDPNSIVHVYFLIVFWLEVIIHNEVYRAVISVLRATFQNVILRNSPIIFAKFASAIKRISESTGYDANAKQNMEPMISKIRHVRNAESEHMMLCLNQLENMRYAR